MNFAFRTLRLENWLAFSGRTTIQFPEFQPGKNLTVIHGDNGYGKTSLLRALRFVFEGKRLARDELLDLWHQGARDAGPGTLEVALDFTHRGRECKIVRGCDFEARSGGFSAKSRVALFFDGQHQEDLVEDKIQELLPRDCLDFILFDGAEISRYARGKNEKDTREAIEKILGIPAARNLRMDLNDVIKSLEHEQQELLEESDQGGALVLEVGELVGQLENHRKHRSELKRKKESLQQFCDELEGEREQIRAIETELNAQQEKNRRKADLDERIGEFDTKMRSLVKELPLFMLSGPLHEIVEEMRAKEKVSPKVQTLDARLRTLMELVDESACLCGREIDAEIQARLRDQLSSLKELLGDRALGSNAPSEDLIALDALLRSLRSRRTDSANLIDRRAKLETEREEVQDDLIQLGKRLKDHPDANVADISQQLGEVGQQLSDLADEIQGVEKNIGRTENELVEQQRKLDQLGVVDEQAKGVTQTLQAANKARSAISELLDRLVDEKRSTVESSATDTFRRITNKPEEYERLRLRRDYSLEVVRTDGSVVSNSRLSAGEKEVVAYSFITALNLASANPAPFVMDTPFGHLDSGHRRGLLNSLPDLQVQAILLATDRDLPPEDRDSIDGSLAKEFVLKRDQQLATSLIEEDEP